MEVSMFRIDDPKDIAEDYTFCTYVMSTTSELEDRLTPTVYGAAEVKQWLDRLVAGLS